MTKQEVKSILASRGLGAKKKYGQNFLIDQNIQEKIVKAAQIKDTDTIVEIGPGLGALTSHIVKRTNLLHLYEIDQGLVSFLEETYRNKGVMIYHQDILQADLQFPTSIKVISNLPYYITSPVLFYLLENNQPISDIVVMMQKEVAERLGATPKTKQYNALTVILSYLADVKVLFHVPKTSFYPAPEVDGSVVLIQPYQQIKRDPETPSFIRFVKNCFHQRRKTLLNNLSSTYHIAKKDLDLLLEESIHTLTVRAEELSLDQFMQLYEELKKRELI
jgi:16S rRNA (adenine1518-N6/adenine1519-N6)-dimethyltransferase